MNIHGLSEKDLAFLFKSRSLEEINTKINELQKSSKKELTDYDILDKLSNGKGTEAYQKLSQHRLQSKEYYNSFQFITDKKMMNLKSKEGLNMHIFRNKNQYKKAPKDLKTMYKFVKAGYFINEGYSPCHNIPPELDTYDYRKKTLQLMLYCVRHNLLKNRNKWSTLGNISFRGRKNSSFEGCQFIYNDKSGKLVVDNHNRGTWDYGKHGSSAHFLYDINPWLNYGNGNNIETEDLFIMDEKTEKEYLNANNDILNNLLNKEPEDIKSTWENCINFLKDVVASKGGSSVENIKYVCDGDEYLQEEKDRVNAIRNEYIDDFIEKNVYRLEQTYKPEYDKYSSFIDFTESSDLLDRHLHDYKDMISHGNVQFEKQDYNEFSTNIMRSVLTSGLIETKENDKIDINLGVYELYFSDEYINNINNKITNHPIAIDIINEEYNKYIEYITNSLNKAFSQFNIEIRVLDNNISEHSKVSYSIKMIHVISREESIILGKNNFTRGISDEDKPKYNETILEEESEENLNIYHTPEYLL